MTPIPLLNSRHAERSRKTDESAMLHLMRHVFALTLLLFLCGCPPTATTTPVLINELQSSNQLTIADEAGEFDDWIELYNPATNDEDISGFYLSDDTINPTRWIFPADSVVPAEGYLVVWCDGDTGQGPLHTGFKLSAGGEEIGFYGPAEEYYSLVDRIEFNPMDADTSLGRSPDGGPDLITFDEPTPGEANQ